jgi:hypothetical protein
MARLMGRCFIHADSYLLDENMKCLWGVNKFRVRQEPLYSVLAVPLGHNQYANGGFLQCVWTLESALPNKYLIQVGDVINPGKVTEKTLGRGAVFKASYGVEHDF